jgi:hypothetical protein
LVTAGKDKSKRLRIQLVVLFLLLRVAKEVKDVSAFYESGNGTEAA